LALATQTLMEAAASLVTAVTPGRQHYHPGHPKAWVTFQGSDGTILASYNVSTVTRNAAGNYTIDFTTAFSNANYAVTAWAPDLTGGSGSSTVVTANQGDTKSTTQCQIRTRRSTNDTAGDPAYVCLAFFGDQS
jgi:hypothetical protein